MISLLYILVSFSLLGQVFGGSCYYCATPTLNNNWHLSGFPRNDPPAGISFENCLTPNQQTVKKECKGLCVEIIFPNDQSVEVVRGCYADLIAGDISIAPEPLTESCEYVPISADAVPDALSIAATRFCTPEEDEVCNGELLSSTSGKTALANLKCNTAPTLNCVSCAKYDGKGKCTRSKEPKDQKVSIGNYCKKMEGKLGGHDYVERDAALIAPFSGDNICFDNTNFNVVSMKFGGTNASITRAKRDVIEQFKGSVCYCKTQMCNSSNELRATLLPIVTSLIAFLSALPLF